jgi:1,5-anhydro-D-fructose reductase (1,5-anhydro-D-mannitol-forming)
MVRPLAWGLIGVGVHAERRVLRSFGLTSGAKLSAVCSRDPEKARRVAEQYGAEHACDSLEHMLKNPALDALYIATPNNVHAAQAIEAARAGKHVLCEKPMALTERDCEAMIEACARQRVKLGIVLQNRHHPAHVEARRLVRSGALGTVSVARAQYGNSLVAAVMRRGWRADPAIAGGGALMGTGLHPIDLLRFLLESEIVEVRAWCEPGPPRVDDIVHAILRFANGACATVISGAIAFSDNDVVLYGEEAKLTCQGTVGMARTGQLRVEGDTVNPAMTFASADPEAANYAAAIEDFGRCVREDTEPEGSGYDGLQLCRIACAILESARGGKAVALSA